VKLDTNFWSKTKPLEKVRLLLARLVDTAKKLAGGNNGIFPEVEQKRVGECCHTKPAVFDSDHNMSGLLQNFANSPTLRV